MKRVVELNCDCIGIRYPDNNTGCDDCTPKRQLVFILPHTSMLWTSIQACPKCMEKDHQCKKGNKIALKSTNLQTQGGATEPEFASMVGLPDAIHVGKSLECFHAK